MQDYDPIEEPPPIERSSALPPGAGKGFFIAFRHRRPEAAEARQPDAVKPADAPPSARPAPPPKAPVTADPPPSKYEPSWTLRSQRPRRSEEPEQADDRAMHGGLARILAIAAIALVVIGMQAWTLVRLSRVRGELTSATSSLTEARGSLGTLWETTKDLDQDQMVRLALLSDSIRSVFAYAQGQINLWEAAYDAQQRRIEDDAGRIGRNGDAIARVTTAARAVDGRLDALAGTDRTQQSRLDALARDDRSQTSLLETLAGRTQSNETMIRDVSATLSGLRQTLASLDGQLAAMEDRHTTSATAIQELHTRVDGVAGWVDGWRRTGLTGPAVEDRLASLADELRRVRISVDSMRFRSTTVRPAESRF